MKFKNIIKRIIHVIIHKSIFMVLAIRNNIITQGITHDLDKLSTDSMVAYGKCDPALYKQFVFKHRVQSKHHPQYWHMRNKPIPDKYLVEIATDFMAVSYKKPNGLKPVAYLRKNLHSKYKSLISTKDLLRLVDIFDRLGYYK